MRLAGAFLAVALVAAGAVVLIVNQSTRSSFHSYVGQQNIANSSGDVIDRLEEHYASTGSWNGAQDVLPGQRGQGGQGGGPRFVVADTAYTIVAANDQTLVGEKLASSERDLALPLAADGRTVGYLFRQTGSVQALSAAERQFLDNVTDALVMAAIGAVVLAVAMGAALAWMLVRPLRHLRQSALAIEQGRLGARVPVTGTVEFQDVAASFNQMSAALAESETLRQRMTTDIAHELRSPLSVMRSQLEAMLDGVFPLNAEQVAIVYDQNLHLGRLVEDLRTLTRAEAGRLSMDLTRIEPGELVQHVATEFAPLAQDQDIALAVEVAPDLPPIRADRDRLRQVFTNLLVNALKHTPAGGSITLRVDEGAGGVRFEVADTGPGLTPDQAKHVFERFYRTDDARQRDHGGSGLGLAITQELVRLHGGRVWVESTPGAGSRFMVELPRAEA
jgi:two-component system OmpR family sensor kinase/two-component system sensor histidine kinase BaeS